MSTVMRVSESARAKNPRKAVPVVENVAMTDVPAVMVPGVPGTTAVPSRSKVKSPSARVSCVPPFCKKCFETTKKKSKEL